MSEVGQVERHFGIVTRVIGAEGQLGRVFFQSDTLTGDSEWPVAANVRFPHAGPKDGMFWVPQVNDLVEIEIDRANEHAIPRIVGMGYSSEDEPADVFAEDYPFVRGWASRAGHFIAWCINPLNKFLRIFHPSGSGISWDDAGNEEHKAAADRLIETTGDTSRIHDGATSETYSKEVDRSYLEKVQETYSDEYVREATGAVTETSKTSHAVVAPKITLGSKNSAEPLVLGTAFTSLYNAHTHVGNLGGPTSAPLVPMSAAHVSAKAFTEL